MGVVVEAAVVVIGAVVVEAVIGLSTDPLVLLVVSEEGMGVIVELVIGFSTDPLVLLFQTPAPLSRPAPLPAGPVRKGLDFFGGAKDSALFT